MYCMNCGKKVNKEENYCTYCGTPLKEQTKDELNEMNNNETKKTSTSTILGILSCVFILAPIISLPLAIISIIVGINERKKENNTSTGLVLGIISLVLTLIMSVILILLISFATRTISKTIERGNIDNIIDNYSEYYKDFFDDIGDKEQIKGYSYLENNSQQQASLYLNTDETYIWYESDNNHEDNYYKGTYTIYNSKEAETIIKENLKEFGLAEDIQEELFENKEGDGYLIILKCNTKKIKNEEQNNINKTDYYFATYNKEKETLELTNILTKEKTSFKRNKKLTDIDI